MAEKACHSFGSTTQVGLTQVLGIMIIAMRLLPLICVLLSSCTSTRRDSPIFSPSDCAAAYEYHFLNRSAQAGDAIGVSLLLRKGANPNSSTSNQYAACVAGVDLGSPLMAAISQRHYKVVELLLSAGADPNLPEGDGTTPYVAAEKSGDSRLMELLKAYGK